MLFYGKVSTVQESCIKVSRPPFFFAIKLKRMQCNQKMKLISFSNYQFCVTKQKSAADDEYTKLLNGNGSTWHGMARHASLGWNTICLSNIIKTYSYMFVGHLREVSITIYFYTIRIAILSAREMLNPIFKPYNFPLIHRIKSVSS